MMKGGVHDKGACMAKGTCRVKGTCVAQGSEACMALDVHGSWHTLQGGMCGRGCTLQRVCMGRGVCMAGRACMQERQSLKWAVHILLECILVLKLDLHISGNK